MTPMPPLTPTVTTRAGCSHLVRRIDLPGVRVRPAARCPACNDKVLRQTTKRKEVTT